MIDLLGLIDHDIFNNTNNTHWLQQVMTGQRPSFSSLIELEKKNFFLLVFQIYSHTDIIARGGGLRCRRAGNLHFE